MTGHMTNQECPNLCPTTHVTPASAGQMHHCMYRNAQTLYFSKEKLQILRNEIST